MCNTYSNLMSQEAMRRLFRVDRDETGNMPPLPGIYPDQMAPVVRLAADGKRELTMMRWGFPPPPKLGNRPVTNIRNLQSSYWRGWLKPEYRVLCPATAFMEYTDSSPKVPTWFALEESRPVFAFAGLWRPWTGERKKEVKEHRLFAFLTTDSNDDVRPVHAKAMPVLLRTPEEWDAWLTAPVEAAVRMQQPLPTAALTIVRRGSKQDATSDGLAPDVAAPAMIP